MSSVYRSVAAWRHAIESMLSLGRQLSDPQWAAPTECPKWTVKDVYAHLIGGEWWMIEGHPLPEQGIDSWAAEPVLARRDATPAAIMDELREVYERRRVELDRGGIDPEQPAYLATGRAATLDLLLRNRVVDAWVHEQDVRRAVGRPGNLASPGAAIAGDLFVAAFPRIVAKSAGAPPGSTVRLTTTGEVSVAVAVAVDQTGRGSLVAPGQPALAHLTMGWEAYTRLSCGRGARADYEVRITGDRALAERVLANLATTP
ncbi:MAG: maleylpyruvate isomerase family mycothiol-dependent enzyme [Micromonosporaceae bacterium]|nr:maleylpyruvate isomerase family mycothiol-dependent enzyme [Micromonosporaceae bacterium]